MRAIALAGPVANFRDLRNLEGFRRKRSGETYVKIRGQWGYLHRAIDKHGNPVDLLPTAKRDLEAAKRFFCKMLKDQPLVAPDRIGTDEGKTFPAAINTAVKEGLLRKNPTHRATKLLQQGLKAIISG